jgi:hypothetical protein
MTIAAATAQVVALLDRHARMVGVRFGAAEDAGQHPDQHYEDLGELGTLSAIRVE